MYLLDVLKRPFNTWFPIPHTQGAQGLGTFSGVYLPSILQMLGVILFMRLSWITGHIGLPKMAVIITIASSILFLTALSLTSIVTNMKIGSGGSYYIISRSLGMEFGSAIGLLLTLAQLITVAVCVSGFSLSLQELLPHVPFTILQIGTLCALTLISLFPVDFALKAQGIIFCIVIAAILSVLMGSLSELPKTLSPTNPAIPLSFWAAFALFFPATTGIESGMAMSGDLKTPSRSLAIGTLAAVITAYVVYASLSIFLTANVPRSLLQSYPMIMHNISKFELLFILGIWGATLSSALGGLLTAPRTLQALAKDAILPAAFAKGYGHIHHPRLASLLVVGLAVCMTVFTDMNHLLPILSMVCLMTYGMLNFVAFFESLLKNPSWRPLFKTPPMLSLIGTLACIVSMFMIHAGWSFIALLAVGLLCFWTTKRKLKGNWDDIRYSIFSFFASTATNKLVHIKKNPRSWRPNILAMINPDLQDQELIQFAHCLNQSKGFLTFGSTIVPNHPHSIETVQTSFKSHFENADIPCFFHINSQKSSILGAHHIVQNYGLGPLQPNTIILKPPTENISSFCALIYAIFELQKNLIIFKGHPSTGPCDTAHPHKQIDLWWGGKYHSNFELSLALAHIMQSGGQWLDAQITIKTLVRTESNRAHLSKLFEKYHQTLRFSHLNFEPYIHETTDFYTHLTQYSATTALTFLGLRPPKPQEPQKAYLSYYSTLMEKTADIPAVAYVLAGENLNFQKIFQ